MSFPKVTQSSWSCVLPQVLIIVGLIALFAITLKGDDAWIFALLLYSAYLFGIRRLLSRHFQAGTRATAQDRHEEAIAHFKESQAFFERHPWIDRFRSVVLMSPSSWSYREMSLMNQAFSYSQLGKGKETVALYRRLAEEYPHNLVVRNILRLIDSVTRENAA